MSSLPAPEKLQHLMSRTAVELRLLVPLFPLHQHTACSGKLRLWLFHAQVLQPQLEACSHQMHPHYV